MKKLEKIYVLKHKRKQKRKIKRNQWNFEKKIIKAFKTWISSVLAVLESSLNGISFPLSLNFSFRLN